MERELKIRYRADFDVNREIICKAGYIDSGASKAAYKLNDTCYKLPIGDGVLDSTSFTVNTKYPYEMKDFDRFIESTVAYYHPELVWSIGQIVLEIMVWEHLLELEKQGYDISGFARIKDYYIDCNGVPVIEQEYVCCPYERREELGLSYWNASDWAEKNRKTLDALSDMGFDLTDIGSHNMSFDYNGNIKVFDFGLSKNSLLYSYETYDSYNSYSYDSYYDSYNSDDSCTEIEF